MVDAKHPPLRLADLGAEQIVADQIVLNKTDLVSEIELKNVEAAIRRLNPLAPIHRAQRSNVPLDAILGRGGFDLAPHRRELPEFLEPRPGGEEGHVHDEHQDHDHDHDHHHHHGDHDHDHHGHAHEDHAAAAGIRGISLTLDKPVNGQRITNWLNQLLADQGPDILRAKGILDVAGEDRRLVFQAVHMILEGDFQGEWKAGDKRYSRIAPFAATDEAAAHRPRPTAEFVWPRPTCLKPLACRVEFITPMKRS